MNRQGLLGRIVTGAIVGVGLAATVATPAFADPAGPTDYLSEALRLLENHPKVGAFCGSIEPAFEVPPPAWTQPHWESLAIRTGK